MRPGRQIAGGQDGRDADMPGRLADPRDVVLVRACHARKIPGRVGGGMAGQYEPGSAESFRTPRPRTDGEPPADRGRQVARVPVGRDDEAGGRLFGNRDGDAQWSLLVAVDRRGSSFDEEAVRMG